MVEDSYELEKALTQGLNKDQVNAFDEIIDFFLGKTNSEAFVLMGYAGTGKLQPLTEPILTPKGWILMKDIKKGSSVIDPVTGQAIKVLETYPQENLNIYKVFFNDGTWTECCDYHLWKVATTKELRNDNWSIRTLKNIIDLGIKNNQGGNRFSIPLTKEIAFTSTEIPLHPYLLGLLLGDGYIPAKKSSEITMTTHEDSYEYIFSCFNKDLPAGIEVRKRKQADNTKARRMGITYQLKPILKTLGLLGTKARSKFIPDCYLYNTIEVRKAILAGLLDTDGTVKVFQTKKKISYSTMSTFLRDGVCNLVRSLGGIANYSKSNRDGEYTVSIRLPFNPFRIDNKKEKANKHSNHFKFVKKIVDVKFVRKDKGQCILVNSTDHLYITRGYTVTHNTFLVKRIVQWINATQKRNRIAITAPTNKAVRVLYSMGEFEEEEVKHYGVDIFDSLKDTTSSIKYSTIHKLLGLREKITAKGEQLFTSEFNVKNELDQCNYLIVDECSMLNDALCKDVMKACDKVKILFMGDPAQIPPVKRKDCIPFREDHGYNFGRASLKEIMRQKGDHPVVDASFLIRNNLSVAQPIPTLATKLNEKGHGIIYLNSSEDRAEVRPLLNQYFNCTEFREDANYAKIIAWTNKVVNYMNTVVRELMYGIGVPAFVIGEKLIVSKPIFAEYSGIIFNTSEELVVVDIQIKEKDFSRGQYKMKGKLYNLKVEAYDSGSKLKIKRNIEVVHEDSMKEYKALVNKAFATAKATSGHPAKALWRTYFDLLKWSADVAYNYAITAHKSQGSSYTNVILMEENLDKNPNIVERNRIKYTSYSRPTDRLFILRDNYE